MRILAKILRTLSKIGKWYTRRHVAVKLLIFLVFFVLPIGIYAYMEAIKEFSKPIIYIGAPAGSEPQISLPYASVSCNSFFTGKRLYVVGFFTVSDTCYLINDSTYLYELPRGYAVMKIYGNTSSSTVYVIVLQKVSKFTLANRTIELSQIALAIFADSLDSQTLRAILDENGLRDVFCSTVVPSSSWSTSSVPMDTFIEVCSNR